MYIPFEPAASQARQRRQIRRCGSRQCRLPLVQIQSLGPINADRKSGLHLFLCTYHLNRRPHRRVSAVKSAAAAADEVGCRWFKSSHSDQINADRKSGLHFFLCTYNLNRRPRRRASAVKSAAAAADVGAIHESPNILCPLSRYSLQ
jgi:hypothetical protein